ncbi:MAG: PAS domain S-box protein [Blastocatellales bacterium]
MSTSHAKVLLVEDDPLHAQVIEGMALSDGGLFEIEMEESLDKSLERLSRGGIDLVLLDLALPDSQGMDTFTGIRRKFPHLPIIILTATDNEEVVLEAIKAGAQDYLVKWRMDSHLLQRSMRYAIERNRVETSLREQEQDEINRRKLDEAALRESEDRYRDLVENSGLFIGTHDAKGRILTVNQTVLSFLGLRDAEELSGRAISDFLPERARPFFQDYLNAVLTEGKAAGMVKFKAPGGQSIFIEYTNSLRLDVEGSPIVRCIGRDITKRARAEAALRESEERLRLALTAAGMGAWEWNLAADKIIGDDYTRELLDGASGMAAVLERIHPDDRENVKRQIRNGIENDAIQNLQFRVISGKGEERWVESSASLRRDESGNPESAIGVAQDITARKRAQEQLREQAGLLDDSTDAIALLDLENGITFWSRGAERLYGWKFDEVKGKRLVEFLYKETPPDFDELEQTLYEQGKWRGELEQVTKGGDEIVVESRRTLIRDELGNPKSVFVINTDISEKKQFEAVVLRAQRLESIGSLASAIAHDLNNVLAPILMALHTLQQRFTDENSQRWLSLMHKSAERGKDLIERVLAFARGAEGERAPLPTANLIRDIARILKETLPKNIELQVQTPEDLWNVIGDTTQIHQVLMNLCINARDAMPDGGKLMIKARNRYLVEEEKRLVTNPLQKQYVRITVADTGAGIPQEIIDRVFDPFFTTKDKGKGSGLGLSTALAIVRGHGGFVNLFSKVGKGTEFKVYLPAQESVAVKPSEVIEADLPLGRGELILIVDDEADIREVTATTLGKYGYRVLSARDGHEAVQIYRQRGNEIQLVVTDMVMPNLDGPSTIRALRAFDPNVLVIATSGERQAEKIDEVARLGVSAFLPKPHTAEKLLEVVATSLNGHPAIKQ